MKTEFLYLIVSADGACWRLVGQSTEQANLTDLLAEGWRPVRETTFGDARVLILLNREAEGKFGFGFNPS